MKKSWKTLNKLLFRYHVWVLTSILFACSTTTPPGSGEVLVRVYDRYLYASDLEGIVPPGSSARDSLTMVRTFIQSWVDKQLIVKKAEENLPDDLKDFSAQLEEYRQSLIIFEYEKMLVRQELDTNITADDISAYLPADSISPEPIVEKQIRKTILNKRKNDLIKNMRQSVLEDAIEHNQVEIY